MGLRYGLAFADIAKVTLLDESKIIVDILRSLIETGAIIFAGYWTYERFIKSREEHPYPKIQHQIKCHKVDFSKGGLIFLSVFVTITNEGKHKIDEVVGRLDIEPISPLPKEFKDLVEEKVNEAGDTAIRLGKIPELFVDEQRFRLKALGMRRWSQDGLEPGQTKVMRFDFLIEEYVDMISVINRFNYEKSGSDTDFITLHSLKMRHTSADDALES